jgi:PKD domain
MPSPTRRSPWDQFLRTLFPRHARPVARPRRSAILAGVELLEDRAQPSTLTLLGQQFTGGSGNEVGTGIAVAPAGAGYAVYLSGRSDANDGDGLLTRFNVPADLSAATQAWSQSWPGAAGYDPFNSVAATPTAVYAFGDGYSHTTDLVGDKEVKAITVAFPAAGGPSTWERQTPAAPGAFPYGGVEEGLAITSAIEGGQTFLYATGYAQENGINGGRIYLSKLDTAGNVLWTQVNPLPAGQVAFNSIGEAVTAAGGNVFVAGWNLDTGTVRATLRKYDAAGTLQWANTTDPGLFVGVTVDPATGDVYAVGGTNSEPGDFLASKFDAAGNLVWSHTFDRAGGADRLTGAVLANGRLYAVGSTSGGGTAGGSDGLVLDLDPATGAVAGTTLWGGAGDDNFTGIAATPAGLHVAGATASFGAGGTDAAYIRYGFDGTPANSAPTASAGGPYAITYGDGLTLNGAGSSDPDGDALTYSWTVNGHAAAATGVSPTLTWAALAALGVDHAGAYSVAVTVDDGHGHAATSAAAPLSVNKAVLAITAPGVTKTYGQTVTLTGTVAGVVPGDGIGYTFASAGTAAGAGVAGSPYAITADLSDLNDRIGNYDVSFALGAVTVTKATPVVTVTGGSYVYNEQAHPATGAVVGVGGASLGTPAFAYSYTDTAGHVVVLGGPPIDPGYYTVAATYPGNANYTAAVPATATITIAYEARTLTDLSRAFNAGRTIPIKLQLLDAAGFNVSAANIGLTALRLARVNSDGTRTAVALQDSGNANPGNLFRYDAGLQGYIFNLSTKNLGVGQYEFAWGAVGDPTEHVLRFSLI